MQLMIPLLDEFCFFPIKQALDFILNKRSCFIIFDNIIDLNRVALPIDLKPFTTQNYFKLLTL